MGSSRRAEYVPFLLEPPRLPRFAADLRLGHASAALHVRNAAVLNGVVFISLVQTLLSLCGNEERLSALRLQNISAPDAPTFKSSTWRTPFRSRTITTITAMRPFRHARPLHGRSHVGPSTRRCRTGSVRACNALFRWRSPCVTTVCGHPMHRLAGRVAIPGGVFPGPHQHQHWASAACSPQPRLFGRQSCVSGPPLP